MSERRTRDPVNQPLLEVRESFGQVSLGLMSNQCWHNDPRRLLFSMSRYKFVSKMLSGRSKVLEVGCGDGFMARIVKQEVEHLTISDYDELFVQEFVNSNLDPNWPIEAVVHDMLAGPFPEQFDGIYALDVLEHIDPGKEGVFLTNITSSLAPTGVVLIGMPSAESQLYASPLSRAGHVNCKSAPELRATLGEHFHQVFLFSMNDEVVHTGFNKMAHYFIALCCQKKTGQ